MTETQHETGNILLVRHGDDVPDELLNALNQCGHVTQVQSWEAARSLLQSDEIRWVISSRTEYPHRDDELTGRLGVVLNSINQAVVIFAENGDITWRNAVAGQFPDEVWDRVRSVCRQEGRADEENKRTRGSRRLSLVVNDEFYYDATITRVEGAEEATLEWVAVVSDVTRSRRLQKKMDAIDNAGRELVRVDAEVLESMDVRQRLELLEQKVLRNTRELLDFDNFAIRLLDKNTNKLDLVLCAGLPPEAQQIDIYASTENSGISGYVAATGRSYICPDVKQDPRYLIGIDNAMSSLTVPLRLHDQVIGILNIESDHIAAFSEDDRQFAEIFGRYVAIALHILDLLVVERHTTTDRLADNVSAEIAGPLGDILADATTLMEDYIGHDDLRQRLQSISENVMKIKERIREVTRPADGILGSKPKFAQKDPILEDKRVLVIDDEEAILGAVRDVLTKYGCEVETARDGDEALAMLSRREYTVVLTDIRLPGHNGYEIFHAVKQRNEAIPVIFMTGFGYDPNHSIIRANQEGLSAVLFKPFKVDQLLSEVREAVSAS